MTLKSDAKFEEKLFVVLKLARIWWALTRALESLKSLDFDWFFLSKAHNIWPIKVQRSYLSWHWRVMQNLKKNWLVAWKMTWGIWQIFTRALESVKIGTLMGFFFPKLKIYELKIYSHDNEEWCKNWRGIVSSKLRGIWRMFIRALKNLKNVDFTGLPLTKVYNVWAKKVLRS